MEDKNIQIAKETNIFEEDAGGTEQIAKNVKTRLVSLLAENFESLEGMSKKTGIPESTLASYMRGVRRPGIDKLIDIANAYNVSIQWLVGLSDHKSNLLSYKDGSENMAHRYSLESSCVRIETARMMFSGFHNGIKNNKFSYENYYKSYYKSLDDYLRIQNRREKLFYDGKITLEEIISLNKLEAFLSSDILPLECQEELLNNVNDTIKFNNYDLIFIDKNLYFNFDIIDNKVVCLEQRLSDDSVDNRMRRNYIYIYDQSIIDDYREERKYLKKMAIKSFTNSQVIELLIEHLKDGPESIKKAFSVIRMREKKLMEFMAGK